jgi:hypothetical protein
MTVGTDTYPMYDPSRPVLLPILISPSSCGAGAYLTGCINVDNG